MNIQQKLAEIEQAGIRLSASGHNIAYEPKRKLTRDMALWLAANKPDVIDILNTEKKQKRDLIYAMIKVFIRAEIYIEKVKAEVDRLLTDDDYLALISIEQINKLMMEAEEVIEGLYYVPK